MIAPLRSADGAADQRAASSAIMRIVADDRAEPGASRAAEQCPGPRVRFTTGQRAAGQDRDPQAGRFQGGHRQTPLRLSP